MFFNRRLSNDQDQESYILYIFAFENASGAEGLDEAFTSKADVSQIFTYEWCHKRVAYAHKIFHDATIIALGPKSKGAACRR